MIRLFLGFELGKFAKYYKTKTGAKILTTLLFALVFLFVAAGIYSFFVSGFRTISFETDADIRAAITLFIYEVFLIVLAGIVIVSSLISGIFNLFRGGYTNWLISSPSYTLFPRIVFMKSFLASLFPSLVMFIPALLALQKVFKIGITGGVLLFIAIIIFILLLNALTLFTLTVVSFVYYKIAEQVRFVQFSFKGLVVLLLLITTLIVGVISFQVKSVDLVQLFRAENVDDTTINITTIGSYFDTLPSHQLALLILHVQNKELTSGVTTFFILCLIALVALILWRITSSLYYPVWQKLQEGTGLGNENTTKTLEAKAYRFTGSSTQAIFKKEMLVSSRNMKGVLWFLFLMFIWLMQIGANLVLGNNIAKYQPDVNEKLILLQTFQFIIALYFTAAFTLRFVFPSFSTEKKSAWILGSAPISIKKIFYGKYFFYSVLFVTVGVLMSIINTSVLGLSITNALHSLVLLVVSVLAIVTFGLSLGALFPNTETDDPEVISTSMTGFFFTALALFYGAISTYVLREMLTGGNSALEILFIISTLIVTGLLAILTPRYLSSTTKKALS